MSIKFASTPRAGVTSDANTATDKNALIDAETLPLEEGLGHLRSGRWDHAVVALRLALQREPGRFVAVRALASAYVQSGDVADARTLLDNFTADHPMNAQGWQLSAQLEWKLNHRQRATEIVAAGLKRLPNEPSLHQLRALYLAAAGNLADAAEHVKQTDLAAKSTETSPSRINGYLAAAVGASRRPPELLQPLEADGEGADHDWLDQIAQDPTLLEALLRFDQDAFTSDAAPTLSLEHRQMLLNLEWKLSRLLEAQPRHADRQLLLARLQFALGSFPAALLSVQRALRANAKLTGAHRLRALIHFRIGEVQTAIEILQQLLKNGLSWPDIHYEIAALEQRRGCDSQARGHLYNAIRLNPNFQQAKDLLERCAA